MLLENGERRKFRKDHNQLRRHARELIKLRPMLGKNAARAASNVIEQVYQIDDEDDLDRLRPYMADARKRLAAALRDEPRRAKGGP